ncbi:MAG: DNA polymerase III subunit delta [Clostridia bacterium]|nr:DNA polymerase III subunit delta [Clostridia bacterium]
MKFLELKNSVKNEIFPIYYIEGEDAFLRQNALITLKNAFLVEPDFNLTNFTGADLKADIESFLTAVRSYPFLSDKRIIVVSEYYPTATDLKGKKLKEFFNTVEETSIVIFINSKACAPLKNQPNITVVDCNKLDLESIVKYLRASLLKSNIVIDSSAVQMLVEYTSYDMAKINGEINKLISYVGDNGVIDEEAVNAITVKDTEYQIYELSGYIADKNNQKAFQTLSDMLSKNEDKQKLFISIYFHFRRLLHVSISNLSDVELANSLGVKEFAVKKAKMQARKFNVKRLKSICDKLCEFDTAFKCGEISLDSVLWNSIFNAFANN